MLNLAKPWWLSKTIFAALAILLVQLLALFGLTLAEGDAEALAEGGRDRKSTRLNSSHVE